MVNWPINYRLIQMAAAKGTMPPNAGKGRGKGSENKVTKELKELIRGALDEVGGQKYLVQQALDNPQAFLSLIGKILPKDINATVNVSVFKQMLDSIDD